MQKSKYQIDCNLGFCRVRVWVEVGTSFTARVKGYIILDIFKVNCEK